MGKMNRFRVIFGGIFAGIVIDIFEGVLNGVVLNQQWADALKALGKSETLSVKQIIAFNVWGLVAGILDRLVVCGDTAAIRARAQDSSIRRAAPPPCFCISSPCL